MAFELPSGVVTLLFTDVEGSTRLLHELGDGYGDVLREHRRSLRAVFAAHDSFAARPVLDRLEAELPSERVAAAHDAAAEARLDDLVDQALAVVAPKVDSRFNPTKEER